MTNSNNSLSNLENGKFKITKSSSITKDTNADLLDILDLNNKIIDRNNLAKSISINRYENGKNKINNWLPSWKLIIRGWKELIIDETQYSDILLEYKTILDNKPNNYEKRLEELDSILTERIILDSNNMIEFKYVDTFSWNKKAKEEAEIAYKQLSKLEEYKGKIILLSKKNGRFNDYFIIKLTEQEINKINSQKDKSKENKEIDPEAEDNTNNPESKEKEEPKDNKNQESEENKKDSESESVQESLDPEKEELKKENKELKEKLDKLEKELAEIKELLKKLNDEKEKKEWNEDREENKESIEKVNEIVWDLDNKDINYKKDMKKKVEETLRKWWTLILVKWSSQIARLEKIDDKWFKCITCTDEKLKSFIDKTYYVIENWNKSYISYIKKEDLRDFINFDEEVIPKPIPPEPEPNPESEDIELNAVISDMWTDIHRERVSLETEEELRDYYKWLARYDVWNRGKLFFSRWRRRKNMIKEKMNKLAWKAFSMDASLDEKTEKSSDRHELELLNNMDKINKENSVALENPQINELCKDYLQWKVSEDNFKILFNQHVDADVNIQNIIKNAKLPKKQKMTHIWTNILEKLKLQKASSDLMYSVNTEFDAYINDKQDVHIDTINKLIEDYIKEFQQNPKFLDDYKNFLKDKDPSKLKLFFQHNQAIMKMQIKNLKVKIDVLTAWKSAYQIDNKDRQKWRAYKVWHALDKLPRRVQTAGFVWLSIGTGLLTWWLGTVASAARVTWVSAWSVWWMNALKKRTHYTKEQNTHEKNVATDYKNEQAKIAARQEQALKWKRYSRKTYKAKRQLALYDQSTQENFQISNTITDTITDLCSQVRKLTPQEENYIKKNLIQWKVRLDYYRDIWHNFLASTEKEKIERDMNRLEKAIILWSNRLWINITNISNLQATDDDGKVLTYLEIKNDLENSYNKSLIQFKRERRVLAAKYWVGTAVMSAGMSLGMQYLMWTWVFSKDPIPWSMAWLWSSEEFNLWKHELLDTWTRNNIYATSNTISSNPGVTPLSTLDVTYWAWTDATWVLPWRLTPTDYATKFSTVYSNINSMPGLDSWVKTDILSHLSSRSREANRQATTGVSSGFTNDALHGMRCLEWIEQLAKWLADSWYNWKINLFYWGSPYNVPWTWLHNVSERIVNMDFVLNNPWSWGTFRDRLIVPVPLRFNTFKDRILGKKPEDKKPDKPNDKPKWNQDWDIDIGDINPYKPDPVDPTKDPDGFYKDDIGSKKNDDSFKWKTKKITTRWQKIDQIDKSDYGKEYPWDWKLQSEKTTAYDILRVKKLLTQQDLWEITQMQKSWVTNDDILKYVEDRVKMQREWVKEKEKKRAFEQILNQCYDKIPQYLKKFLPKYADKLNLLPDANRIHLVWEYDYLSIAWPGSSGVFRSESWDIYISQKAIEQFENAPALWSIDKWGNQVSTFPRIYREIKHIMVHEMLHSMSILNYKDNNNENENLMRHIWTRRLWLLNINYKNGKMRWYGINEWTTEWLAQFILENRYHDEWLLNYKAPRVAYQQEQDIISKLIKIDWNDIKREDFYKAMLLRKYWDEKNVEFKTPLFELVWKINWWTQLKEWDKKISDKRPHYYQLVMHLMDYVNDKNLNNIGFILEFIEKKDISILKNHFWSTLNTVFDNTLLNKNKTDFNQTILDWYSGKIK